MIAVAFHYADRRFVGTYDEELEASIYIGMALWSRDENQHDEANPTSRSVTPKATVQITKHGQGLRTCSSSVVYPASNRKAGIISSSQEAAELLISFVGEHRDSP